MAALGALGLPPIGVLAALYGEAEAVKAVKRGSLPTLPGLTKAEAALLARQKARKGQPLSSGPVDPC